MASVQSHESMDSDRLSCANHDTAPTTSTEAVLKPSAPLPANIQEVSGVDFNAYRDRNITVAELISDMSNAGFQASSIAEAAKIIDEMRAWRDPSDPDARTTIFLGYTSNLVSSGLRSTLRWLVEHEYVSAIVTTAGGIEEDLIKCLAPTYLSSFSANGAALRSQGMNRIGNLVVPNSNYCAFEDWVVPILDEMLKEQEASRDLPDERDGESDSDFDEEHENLVLPNGHKTTHNSKPTQSNTTSATTTTTTTKPHNQTRPQRNKQRKTRLVWTPSKIIRRLGRLIANPSSILYQAYLHNIPIFCPALTDGSLGDMLYFHTFRSSPLTLDISITRDIRRLNDISLAAKRAGMIVLGGGVVKHHIANACLMRNGADYAVYVNTAQEFDGSDAGARPDEAVSWGKIKSREEGGRCVKVYGEATVVFPLLVAATFAKV